jgi:hypothetical protein
MKTKKTNGITAILVFTAMSTGVFAQTDSKKAAEKENDKKF